MNYVSYWIPSTNVIDFDTLLNELIENDSTNDISDQIEDTDNDLYLKIKNNKDIEFTYLDNTYILSNVVSHNNGVLIYSYETVDQNIDDILDIQVYHYLKDFFHSHESHDDEEDALLHGYKTTEEPTLDNIIEHYCEIYQNKFNDHYDNIISFSSIDIIMNKYLNEETKVHEAINSIAQIQRKINKIEIELIYFNFLLNTLEDINLKDFFINEYKNNIIKFTILYKEYEILDNQLDTEYSQIINKHQILLGILGIVLGLILGGIGWYYGYNGTTEKKQIELNDNNNKTMQVINKNITNIPYQKVITIIDTYNKKNSNSLNIIKKDIVNLNTTINKCQNNIKEINQTIKAKTHNKALEKNKGTVENTKLKSSKVIERK